MFLKLVQFLALSCGFFLSTTYADNPAATVLNLDSHVSNIPGLGFQYGGGKIISQEEALRLFTLAQKRHELESSSGSGQCAICDNQVDAPAIASSNSGSDSGTQWEVVFLARLGLRSGSGGSTSVSPQASAISQLDMDMAEMKTLFDNNQLTNTNIDLILNRSGAALGHSPQAAMAYVAALGDKLSGNYGDSYAGSFVPRFEQMGHLFAGGSVGQCSDIHFAMLKAYKQMVGPNAKAYLVNFQTAGNLHHTNLIVEDQGRINVIDYGNISQNQPGSIDVLAQNSQAHAGHGLAYRIFTDDGEIDSMVAHIDTPLGKFLREVSTGTASYNPFETTNYTTVTAGLENSGGTAVKLFFGELGGGDAVMGVAVNLRGISQLPAGFTLHSYLAASLSYAHKTFRVDSAQETLHSGILYINTGLGLVSPKLELRGFTFQARTDLVLEGGAWIKEYSAMEDDDSRFEGDGNLISRTRIDASLQVARRFRIDASAEIELIPSFRTAFPSSTDGSSGVDGLGQTLGILPNRITASVDLHYTTDSHIDLFAGLTYQHTPLGGVGRVTVGAGSEYLRASAFLQGALDRDQTPIFIPGAERTVGVDLSFCPRTGTRARTPIACFGANASTSLENSSWSTNVTGEFRF